MVRFDITVWRGRHSRRPTAAGGAGPSGGGPRRRARRQEPEELPDEGNDNSSEYSDETEVTDGDAGERLDLVARIWDDLVDMERFWTHAAVAVVEVVAGSLALVAIASCLGAPTLRCVSFAGGRGVRLFWCMAVCRECVW